jgi:uncharacterized protein with PQ loop repeat
MNTLTLSFGIISSILLILIPVPQIIHTIKERDASQLSLYFILFQILANSVFCIYGIIILDVFLIVANSCLVIENIFLLFLKNYYFNINNQSTQSNQSDQSDQSTNNNQVIEIADIVESNV